MSEEGEKGDTHNKDFHKQHCILCVHAFFCDMNM